MKSGDLEIIDIYVDEMKKYSLLTDEETNVLLEKYKLECDLESFQKLVSHNLRLALSKANKFRYNNGNFDFLDLIQESNLILMNAVRAFDMSKGVKLSTYLGTSIDLSLQRNIDGSDKNIKSIHFFEKKRKYSSYVNNYFRDNGEYPTRTQLIEELGFSNNFLDYLENKDFDVLSLHQESPYNCNEELIDTISYDEDVYFDIEREYDELILLRTLYNVLDIRDYYIIYNRIIKNPAKTQEEIGVDLELTRVRVNQLEAKALKKLKPIFEKIQKNGVVNPINKVVDDRMLIPINPRLRSVLSFLKSGLSEDEYFIVYTKLCDFRNDNMKNYYEMIGSENLDNMIIDMDEVIRKFTSLENVEQIYDLYRERLKVKQILELNVLPRKIVRQEGKDDFDICRELEGSNYSKMLSEDVKAFIKRFDGRGNSKLRNCKS